MHFYVCVMFFVAIGLFFAYLIPVHDVKVYKNLMPMIRSIKCSNISVGCRQLLFFTLTASLDMFALGENTIMLTGFCIKKNYRHHCFTDLYVHSAYCCWNENVGCCFLITNSNRLCKLKSYFLLHNFSSIHKVFTYLKLLFFIVNNSVTHILSCKQ